MSSERLIPDRNLTKNKSKSLDDSLDFFDTISTDSDELELELEHNNPNSSSEKNLKNHSNFNTNKLSKVNLELQVMLRQIKIDTRIESGKATCFIFFYKFLVFGTLLINLINGIVAVINPNLIFVKVAPFLAGFVGAVVAVSNLQKQGSERKKVSIILKHSIQKIKTGIVEESYEKKIEVINEVKRDLIQADYALFQVSSEDGLNY